MKGGKLQIEFARSLIKHVMMTIWFNYAATLKRTAKKVAVEVEAAGNGKTEFLAITECNKDRLQASLHL